MFSIAFFVLRNCGNSRLALKHLSKSAPRFGSTKSSEVRYSIQK